MRKLVNFLLIISSIFALFFGANVLRSLGYMIGEDDASTLQKLYPSFYLVSITFILTLINSNISLLYKRKKIEFIFLLFIVFLLSALKFFNTSNISSFIPNTLILPILFSICINEKDIKFIENLKTVIILFFIINCTLSIFERIQNIHYFKSNIEQLDFFGFRSTSSQDHPLNNAFIVSIIMAFILFSGMNLYKKYSYFMLGYFSVICFGSRSSIIICTLILIIHLMQNSFSSIATTKKIITIGFVCIGALMVIYSLFYTSIGERLMNKMYLDESASVRFNVLEIFDMVSSENLLWGNSNEAMEKVTSDVGMATIENFWISWIIRFGLISSPLLIFLFTKFIVKTLEPYSLMNKVFIACTLLSIASTNNSLASNTTALSIFILCTYAFSLEKQHAIVRYQTRQFTPSLSLNEDNHTSLTLLSN